MEIRQPLALHNGKLIQTTQLTPGEVFTLRDEAVLCPVCKKEGRVAIENKGHVFNHDGTHEPETVGRMKAKRLLALQLRYIFSQANIDTDVALGGHNADIAIAHPQGTRIALRYFTANQGFQDLALWKEILMQEKIHFLSILDGSRLPKSIRKKEGTETRPLVVQKLESNLLALGEPLLYFYAPARLLHSPYISPRIVALARAKQGARLGSVPAIFYRHRLSSLRIVQGRWSLDNSYNDPPGMVGYEEKFSDDLAGTLARYNL